MFLEEKIDTYFLKIPDKTLKLTNFDSPLPTCTYLLIINKSSVILRSCFQYGLYSTIMPCFMYIIFGGCKDMTLGPTAIMAFLTYPYASAYGSDYSVLLCFLSGIGILLASLFQLGKL